MRQAFEGEACAMGFRERVAEGGDWLQRVQALWGALPDWVRKAIYGGVAGVGTVIANQMTAVPLSPLVAWLLSIGVVCVVVAMHTLVVGRARYRANGKVPVDPVLTMTVSGGKEACIDIRNSGGPFTLVARAKLVGASRPIDHERTYAFGPR
jgi:hypothetical protein